MWHDHAFQAPITFDLQSMLALLLESLHLELQQQIITHLDELVRPLRDEVSAIKLWLAHVATHLKYVELPSKDPSVDMSSLFGPYVEPPGEHTSLPTWRSSSTPALRFGALRHHQSSFLLQTIAHPHSPWCVRTHVQSV